MAREQTQDQDIDENGWVGLPDELVPLRNEWVATWWQARADAAAVHAEEREADPSLPEKWTDHIVCVQGWALLMQSPKNEARFALLYDWVAGRYRKP
jgi:hypothetical protein